MGLNVKPKKPRRGRWGGPGVGTLFLSPRGASRRAHVADYETLRCSTDIRHRKALARVDAGEKIGADVQHWMVSNVNFHKGSGVSDTLSFESRKVEGIRS